MRAHYIPLYKKHKLQILLKNNNNPINKNIVPITPEESKQLEEFEFEFPVEDIKL